MRAALAPARTQIAAPLAALLVASLSLAAGAAIVERPHQLRLIIALALLGTLLALATIDVRVALLTTFAFLPIVALLRRLLISSAGWTSEDPLLLVAPALAVLLVVRLFVLERRLLARDGLSQLVVALLALILLQTLNPAGGGPVAGAGGFLFVGVPVLWFFVGRELLDSETVRKLFGLTIVLACAIASYGLYQTFEALPSWDDQWTEIAGYAALTVGGATRAFGTFPNTTEYASYLGIACLAAVALALHRRFLALAVLPLAAVALFMAGSRGPVIVCIVGLFVVVGLRMGSFPRAIVTIAVGVAVAVVAVRTYTPLLESRAEASKNPLVGHQVRGLTDPLNPERSTARLHFTGAIDGIREGFRQPLGKGTASISLGGSRFGGTAQSREFDVSNAFLGLGLLGGVLFVLLLVSVARRAVSLYLLSRDPIPLAIVGVLVMSFGHWLNGGLYTIAPLTWLLIGWVAAQTRDRLPAPA